MLLQQYRLLHERGCDCCTYEGCYEGCSGSPSSRQRAPEKPSVDEDRLYICVPATDFRCVRYGTATVGGRLEKQLRRLLAYDLGGSDGHVWTFRYKRPYLVGGK